MISRLSINNSISTNQRKIITEIQSIYKKLYNKRQQNNSKFNFFDESINKLSNIDRTKCEGLITESECLNALKCMKNQKSPGSDGITVEFYKIFWNNIKEFYVNSINYSFETSWTMSLFLRDDQVKRQMTESIKALESKKEMISNLSSERDDLLRR